MTDEQLARLSRFVGGLKKLMQETNVVIDIVAGDGCIRPRFLDTDKASPNIIVKYDQHGDQLVIRDEAP